MPAELLLFLQGKDCDSLSHVNHLSLTLLYVLHALPMDSPVLIGSSAFSDVNTSLSPEQEYTLHENQGPILLFHVFPDFRKVLGISEVLNEVNDGP